MFKTKKVFLLLSFALLSNSYPSKAQTEECIANFYCSPDSVDPLTVHFYFTGHVPAGSFQFLGNWDFGDGNISGDSCPVYQYAQPGTYTVCLLFSICIGGGMSCHDDTCMTVTVSNMTGINNVDGMMHQFNFYPNPAHSKIYFSTDACSEVEIKITGTLGNEIFRRRVMNDNAIDISSLSSGIYFIEASDGVNTLKRKMIVD
jgi:hypothetical protein